MRRADKEVIRDIVRTYEARHNVRLAALRVENRPLLWNNAQVQAAPIEGSTELSVDYCAAQRKLFHDTSSRPNCPASSARVAWILFSIVVAPGIVQSAYDGRSYEILNRLISGRSEHPVEFYLRKWNIASWTALIVTIGGAPAGRLVYTAANYSRLGGSIGFGLRRSFIWPCFGSLLSALNSSCC